MLIFKPHCGPRLKCGPPVYTLIYLPNGHYFDQHPSIHLQSKRAYYMETYPESVTQVLPCQQQLPWWLPKPSGDTNTLAELSLDPGSRRGAPPPFPPAVQLLAKPTCVSEPCSISETCLHFTSPPGESQPSPVFSKTVQICHVWDWWCHAVMLESHLATLESRRLQRFVKAKP